MARFLAASSCLLLLYCSAAFFMSGVAAKSPASIPAYLKSNAQYSRLYNLLKKAKLDTALTSKAEVTFFAPTNKALTASLYSTLDKLPVDTLAAALLFHVAPGVFPSSSLVTGLVLKTLAFRFPDQNTLIADATAKPKSIIIRGVYSAGTVIKANIKVGKSLVHDIDAVLLADLLTAPKFKDIGEAVASRKDLTVFANSLAAYEGARYLLSPFGIYDDTAAGTAFAVSDAAFAKFAVSESCPNKTRLPRDEFVGYSFSFDKIPPARLTADMAVPTLTHDSEEFDTDRPQYLQIKYVGGKPVVWAQPRRRIRSPFFQANIIGSVLTRNAVLYIIDNVLYPLNAGEGPC